MKKIFTQYEIPRIEVEARYVMSPMELREHIPFTVKRLYFLSNMSAGVDTGQHCHFEEEEFFVMARGTCTAIIDRGHGKEEILMSAPQSAMYVPNYVWHGFKNFSEGAVMMALSSTNYRADRSDYLEDYDEYLGLRDEKLSAVQ